MMIHDQAFVMKTVKYQESSLISTILTKENGLISTISKGVRKSGKGAKANILEVGNRIEIEINYNPQKNLQFLQNFQFVDNVGQGTFSPIRQSVMIYVMEIVEKLLKDEEEVAKTFGLIAKYFDTIQNAPKSDVSEVPLLFTLELLNNLGYPIQIWFNRHDIGSLHTEHDEILNKSNLLDDLLKYTNENFQTIGVIRSLPVLRDFLSINK